MATLRLGIDARLARAGARVFQGAAGTVQRAARSAVGQVGSLTKAIVTFGGAFTVFATVRAAIKTSVTCEKTMADLRGVAPANMSLNGRLSMHFGARVGGGFSAHY